MHQAAQEFQYLGHQFNLANHTISPLPNKLQATQNMIKHQLKGRTFQPKNIAAVAGNLLDAAKSNSAIQGLPQQLMQQAALGVKANRWRLGFWHKQMCWRLSTPKTPTLQHLLQQCLEATHLPVQRVLRPSNDHVFILNTDASNKGWGAQLIHHNKETQTCAQTWPATEASLHITHREALASAHAVHHLLPHITPGSQLQLNTDATSTAWAWTKGSKIPNINNPILQMYQEAAKLGIHIKAQHIPGFTNKRADWLSRNPDPKNYQLDHIVYLKVCQHFHFHPNIDLFANRNNRQTKKFCSWRVDQESQGNAFSIPWTQHHCWLNPPWELIGRCLQKIKADKALALVCLPMWVSAPWWRDLQGMLQSAPLILKNIPLYKNPEGEGLPPPRWATLFGVVKG